MSELKPCPFCGGEATYLHIIEIEINGKMYPVDMHEYGCDNVGCSVLPSAKTLSKEQAAEWWNTRAKDKRIEELTEQLEQLERELQQERKDPKIWGDNGAFARADRAEAQLDAVRDIFKWLLGINGCFPSGQTTEGRYYWRTPLRERLKKAGLLEVLGEK